jgi:curli biogenesis system outer membrane secretion channel CsgG
MKWRSRFVLTAWFLAALFTVVLAGAAFAEDEPEVDQSKTSQKLKSLKRKAGPKPVVTIYEFRSSVPEIQAKAGAEMFMGALVKSGAFAVAERQRLNEGVYREKQMSQAGQTTGDAGSALLAGAELIFEVVISEVNAGETEREGNVSVGGMAVGRGSATDAIGMEVRIVDAKSGLVSDAVTVRKKIKASSTSVSGIGKFAQSLANLRGKNIPLDPDMNTKSSRKESIDNALRSCMEAAVYELAKRYGED